MGKVKVTDLVAREITPFLEENGYELFMTEFVKEGKDWYLRVYIDKEEGISIADCEKVSGFLGKRLDELDPIEQNYFLEVSSPGMDRPLIKDSDYEKYKGRIVDVMLYKGVDGSKQFTGELLGLENNTVMIKDDLSGQERAFSMESVAKVKLAVIF